MSEAASSILEFETSPLKEELSSSLIDGAGDASGVEVQALKSAGDDDPSDSSTGCCRLQNIMLAVRVSIIFWFTCHYMTQKIVKLKELPLKLLYHLHIYLLLPSAVKQHAHF